MKRTPEERRNFLAANPDPKGSGFFGGTSGGGTIWSDTPLMAYRFPTEEDARYYGIPVGYEVSVYQSAWQKMLCYGDRSFLDDEETAAWEEADANYRKNQTTEDALIASLIEGRTVSAVDLPNQRIFLNSKMVPFSSIVEDGTVIILLDIPTARFTHGGVVVPVTKLQHKCLCQTGRHTCHPFISRYS